MITASDKTALRMLLQSQPWMIVERIAKELVQNKKEASNLRETEWETAKNVAVEEGYIQGINTLIQELYAQALDRE